MVSLGNPTAVASAAATLGAAAARTGNAAMLAAKPVASWEGAGATAYSESALEAHSLAVGFERTCVAGQGTLERYATTLSMQQAAYDEGSRLFDAAVQRMAESALDPGSHIDAVVARAQALTALDAIKIAAVQAARELDAATGAPPPAHHARTTLSQTVVAPDWKVQTGLLRDAEYDPARLQQGAIGDCGLVSSVMALMRTNSGDALLRMGLRWDATKGGYWVTLFERGKPQEYFVDKVFSDGSLAADPAPSSPDKKQSIAALYEAAYAKAHGHDALQGAQPADVLAAITGDKTHRFDPSGIYTTKGAVTTMSGLKDVVTSGGQVVGATTAYESSVAVQGTFENGVKKGIDIVGSHAYAVTKVEADGSVWIRNAWGPGNPADGGGVFKISAADALKAFSYFDYRPPGSPSREGEGMPIE